MKLLVTGSDGFIGRYVCEEAVKRGISILGLQRNPKPSPHATVQWTLSDPPWDAIKSYAPDALLHLAWLATPGKYLQSEQNIQLLLESKNFILRCWELGVKHFACAGTCAEYEPSTASLQEQQSPLLASSLYSMSKIGLADWLSETIAPYSASCGWYRIFYPYGAREHHARFCSQIAVRCLNKQKSELKFPDSIKDYIHVRDVAMALLTGITAGVTGPYNIGSGVGIRMSELAALIAKETGVDPDMIVHADLSEHKDPWPHHVACIEKMSRLGWKQSVSLEAGIADLVSSIREKH